MITDPIADMLTRIRNANSIKMDKVYIPFSKQKEAISKVLKEEGFISEYKVFNKNMRKSLIIFLNYHPKSKESPIRGLRRISKPGNRIYVGSSNVPRVLRGLGRAIISTSRGLLTDKGCRSNNVGGEVLLYVW